MITKKDYLEARQIVDQYEKEQKDSDFLIEMAKIQFPIGTSVVSMLNTAVRGVVFGYGIWAGLVQLNCKHGDKKTRMLIRNAVKIG